jgi:MATE family multidrug resistance protein
LTAQSAGARDLKACGRYWQAASGLGLAVGVALGVVSLAGGWLLAALGQAPEIAEGGKRVFLMFAWGHPGMGLWIACSFFLEGLSRPMPGMITSLAAVGANALLDWLFIYGGLGLPPMGAEGAALGTSIVRWLMFFALFGYILSLKDREALGLFERAGRYWQVAARLLKLGYPMALSRALESGAFAALTLIAGLLGPVALAGYQITLNLVSLVFMAAVGTSAATMIRVGNAVGRGDPRGISHAGWAGVALIALIMASAMIVFLAIPDTLAALYTSDGQVSAIAGALILIAGLLLIFDGAQVVLQGSLRGLADMWVTSGIQFLSWWAVTVPLGYGLAHALGLGPVGLIWAIFAGALASSSALALRFMVLSRRAVARA